MSIWRRRDRHLSIQAFRHHRPARVLAKTVRTRERERERERDRGLSLTCTRVYLNPREDEHCRRRSRVGSRIVVFVTRSRTSRNTIIPQRLSALNATARMIRQESNSSLEFCQRSCATTSPPQSREYTGIREWNTLENLETRPGPAPVKSAAETPNITALVHRTKKITFRAPGAIRANIFHVPRLLQTCTITVNSCSAREREREGESECSASEPTCVNY